MDVLVTGGTGFLGRALLAALAARGHRIRALARPRPHGRLSAQLPEGCEWLPGDVLDVPSLTEAMQGGVQAVVHAAGVVSYRKQDRPLLKLVNETGTANVVNAMLDAGVPRLVHVSSTAALGRRNAEEWIDENCKFEKSRLDTYYGWSKYLAEKQVYRGVEEGLEAAVGNPSVIVGGSDLARSSGVLVTEAAKGRSWYPPGGNGFVYLGDVASALALLLEGPHTNGERFVLNGENLSYHQFFSMVAQSAGTPVPKRPMSPAWLKAAARAFALAGGRARITPEVALNLANRWYYKNDLFARTFGFRFAPIQHAVDEAVSALKRN